MLRLPSARAIARVQLVAPRRAYSDVKPTIPKSKAPVLPSAPTPATPATPTTPAQVPLTPPSPSKVQTSPPQVSSVKASSPPPPPPSNVAGKPHKKTHKFRNTILGLGVLGALAFSGGVFYSLKSDNFHDFFTEYVPYGEEAVLLIEEREFRRRFPNALAKIQSKPQVDATKVTIPKASGATWKLSEQPEQAAIDVGKPGPHLSSKPDVTIPKDNKVEAKVVEVTKPADKPADKPAEKSAPVVAVPIALVSTSASPVDAVNLPTADPVVQGLVSSINEIISTVNATNSSPTFAAALSTAKAELEKLNTEIEALKSSTDAQIQQKLSERDLEFAQAAQGLMQNISNQVDDIQFHLREEFDQERDRIAAAYQSKLNTELTRAQEIAEQRLRNELLEQAIELKRSWIAEISNRVESERGGRLGKLHELEEAVQELEKLTTQWNEVVSTNLKTQQTFTALEAVRNAVESTEQPAPFLREMAALREVSEGDELIAAAIQSINPRAYQRGVPTPTQLVDRFRRVSEEVRRAALLPEDAGVAAHAGNWVLSKLMFRKRGLAQGGDVESVLAKAETYLEEGDVESATREVNQLTGWARTLASDWLKEARLLLEVKQALDVIAAEARVQSLRVQNDN